MKKIVVAMMAVLLFASCAKQARIPVYVWGSPDADETVQREQFAFFRQHGVTGVCYNCGWDLEMMAKTSALAHEYGLEYHAWIRPGIRSTGWESRLTTIPHMCRITRPSIRIIRR